MIAARAAADFQEHHSRVDYERTTEHSLQAGDADHEHQPWFR